MIPKPEPKVKVPKPLQHKTPLQAKTGFKPVTEIKLKKTAIKRSNGKQYKSWGAFRRKYLLINPPDHAGNYICALCGTTVPANEVTLDHIIPRSRAPHLRTAATNIQFACYTCNHKKGSTVDPAY